MGAPMGCARDERATGTTGLHARMVISPGLFEAVRQILYRLCLLLAP